MNHPKQKIFLAAFLSLAFLFLLPLNSWGAKKSSGGKLAISARSVIFSDSTGMKRLYGKDIYKRVPPASTLKIMTALLVLEKISLEKVVTVSRRALYPQPS